MSFLESSRRRQENGGGVTRQLGNISRTRTQAPHHGDHRDTEKQGQGTSTGGLEWDPGTFGRVSLNRPLVQDQRGRRGTGESPPLTKNPKLGRQEVSRGPRDTARDVEASLGDSPHLGACGHIGVWLRLTTVTRTAPFRSRGGTGWTSEGCSTFLPGSGANLALGVTHDDTRSWGCQPPLPRVPG